MDSTGDVFPTVGASQDRAGGAEGPWTDPGRITADDGLLAECVDTGGSDYLIARAFGFGVSGTILGVTVRMEAREDGSGSVTLNAQLQDDTAALVGSPIGVSLTGTTLVVYTWGGTSNLWGATLTPTIVNHTNFGVRFWFTTSDWVRPDFVTMAIEYTPAASGGGPLTQTRLISGKLLRRLAA